MSECLCDRCSALCCRYFALQIDTPETPAAFDDIRWYLAHENVHVFVEDGLWYLSVQTRCQHLGPDHKCGIYEDRPRICRDYSTDNCDFHVGEYEFEQYFTKPEELEAYAQATLGRRMRSYALQQRIKNIGLNPKKLKPGHPSRPRAAEVLRARLRPRVKGHPSARRSPKVRPAVPTASAGLVQLSIDGLNR